MDRILVLRRAGVVAAGVALVASAGVVVRMVGLPESGSTPALSGPTGPAGPQPGAGSPPAPGASPAPVGRPTPTAATPTATTPGPGGRAGGTRSPGATATASGPTVGLPPSPTPSVSPTLTPSAADLRGALLTPADLPGGLSAQPTGTGVQLGTLSVCPALASAGDGNQAEADVSFTGGQLGPDLTETLLSFTPTEIDPAMRGLEALAASCSGFTVTSHHLSITVTLAAEPFARVGDETVAVRVTATLPAYGVTIQGDLVAVRHGTTVIVLTNVGYPLDTGLTATAVPAAYAKVAARW